MSLTLCEVHRLLDGDGQTWQWQRRHPLTAWAPSIGAPPAGAALSLLLGASWTSLVCAPWVEGIARQRDWQQYARLMLAERLGGEPEDWHVGWQLPQPRQALLVAGVRQTQWQALLAAIRAEGLRLHQALPLFPWLLSQVRPSGDGHATWLLAEAGTLQWATWRLGGWQAGGQIALAAGTSRSGMLAMLQALELSCGRIHWVSADAEAARPFCWSVI